MLLQNQTLYSGHFNLRGITFGQSFNQGNDDVVAPALPSAAEAPEVIHPVLVGVIILNGLAIHQISA